MFERLPGAFWRFVEEFASETMPHGKVSPTV